MAWKASSTSWRAQDASADPQHHRPVPGQERGKGEFGRLVVCTLARREPLQQCAVAKGGRRPAAE